MGVLQLSDIERLKHSCDDSLKFPKNIIHYTTFWHNLLGYYERINEHEGRLFCDEANADVLFRQYDDDIKEFQSIRVASNFELIGQLDGVYKFEHEDPRCRFMFIQARNSRDFLKISRRMLMYALTYYQVMPDFLDLVFAFGVQEYAEDFHFSAFRKEIRLATDERGLDIPQLGRSGQDIRLCYNLKAVESVKGGQGWPWSIRQTAAYHSFDMKTGKAFWIMVKGNQRIRELVESATNPERGNLDSYQSDGLAFATSLTVHLILCEWSSRDWRSYVKYLETSLQDITRRTVAINLDRPAERVRSMTKRNELYTTYSVPPSKASTFNFSRASTMKVAPEILSPPLTPTFEPKSFNMPVVRRRLPPSVPPGLDQSPGVSDSQPDFSFSDFQKVQFIEEKANEASLILKANINILQELQDLYLSLLDPEICPPKMAARLDCQRAITSLAKRIDSICKDLKMHISRLDTLLRLLADRKNLLYGILEFQKMEASKLLTEKTQESTERMELVTADMHQIAEKTKQETIFMRIITLVTLFFLPGTFISTIMSTDIIHFDNQEKEFELGALQLYLALCLPLMLFTFTASGLIYWWTNRRELKFRQKQANEIMNFEV